MESTISDKHLFLQHADRVDLPVFLQPWWLDIVYQEQWQAATVVKGHSLKAVWPYSVHTSANGLKTVKMPKLTQFQGFWLERGTGKYSKELGKQKEYISKLYEKLPPIDQFSQYLMPGQTNWLPLKWLGFSQTSRYTYQVDTSNLDECWKEVLDKTRAEIRKAEKNQIQVEEVAGHEELLSLHKMTFERQGKSYPYSEDLFSRIVSEARKLGKGKVLIAHATGDGKPHAGVFLLEDRGTVYYLIGGGNPELRNSGATSLLIWKAIQYAHSQGKLFDFEGSMIEPIERFFRSFGAKQRQYHAIQYKSTRYQAFEEKSIAKAFVKKKLKSFLGRK